MILDPRGYLTIFCASALSKLKPSHKKSSRSGNESFLTYFRFRSSHTTVRAVRHTAV